MVMDRETHDAIEDLGEYVNKQEKEELITALRHEARIDVIFKILVKNKLITVDELSVMTNEREKYYFDKFNMHLDDN